MSPVPAPVVQRQASTAASTTVVRFNPVYDPRGRMALTAQLTVVLAVSVLATALIFFVSRMTGTSTPPPSSQIAASPSYDEDQWSDTEGQSTVCDDEPDMQVVSVDSVGNDLVVTILVTPAASCDSDTTSAIEDDATQVTLRDSSGDVVADAVFDLSSDASTIPSDGVDIKLSYAPTQFYRPATELERQFEDDHSELIIRYIYAATTGSGASTSTGPSSQSGTVGGESTSDDESEENAREALEWQVKHDESAANAFMSTYTTQLSSKRKDMVIDGKTWSYRDILAHFIKLRDKHPDVLLIWSGDWPNYDGDQTKYYVILSGESFASTDDAWSWCSTNDYEQTDCFPVDLQ